MFASWTLVLDEVVKECGRTRAKNIVHLSGWEKPDRKNEITLVYILSSSHTCILRLKLDLPLDFLLKLKIDRRRARQFVHCYIRNPLRSIVLQFKMSASSKMMDVLTFYLKVDLQYSFVGFWTSYVDLLLETCRDTYAIL